MTLLLPKSMVTEAFNPVRGVGPSDWQVNGRLQSTPHTPHMPRSGNSYPGSDPVTSLLFLSELRGDQVLLAG